MQLGSLVTLRDPSPPAAGLKGGRKGGRERERAPEGARRCESPEIERAGTNGRDARMRVVGGGGTRGGFGGGGGGGGAKICGKEKRKDTSPFDTTNKNDDK